jgi:TP901 family phage tail tape measure protein
MADVNANIGVSIDTSDALNQLKNLQRQISQFHQSVAKSSSAASIAQRDLQKNFINGVNAIQGFSAELRTVRTSAETFTNSLEKNKFSIQQYFRYAASQTKTFGKNFTSEFATIEKTAIERVKTLQTQYIKMGRDANGAMQAIAIRPTVLNMKDLGTQTAIAAQKQVLFNQLIKQGSTNLLNFGKNTQWAGRQLMVGFTLPLATLGMTAGRVFMDMEKAAIKFKKVYGDLFTAPEETQKAMDSITELGLAYTKYGVAVSDSLSVAADAAAAGFQGVDLQNQTTASLKLSVLGQMELQKALETTIALQNAFRISSQDLVGEIDFLNAVENQTVVSLDDITEATPRVATVIQALGGDVRDLAFFLAAMKEGGVNAAQGANALKSGLASLINPTERASELLNGMGINIRAIVSQNQGDLRGTVVGFARALDTLDPMKRAQAIEQLFGKFQFARISALFDNVIREGSQASRVLDLAGSSLSELATLSDKELGVSAASSMNKFKASIEQLKVALAPVGEMFLKIATPFIDFATTTLKAFNNLPDGMKQIIGTVITVVGGLGPVLLMTFGLINNGIANMIKFFATVRLGYLKMTGQAKGIGDETQYMTQEQLEAAAAAASLDQAHAGLTQRFTSEKAAVDALRVAYQQAADAGARFAAINPGMMRPGFVAAPTKMARGGVVSVGGRGNKDTEPALLTPGEAVIPAAMVKQYAPLIEGMIAGNIPGYAKGVMLGMPKSAKSVSKSRDAGEEIYQMFLKSSYANTAPTNYGHQISPTSGHSFPIFGLGGVYQKGNKQVFVKPVLDEKAAFAEMRSTEISRRAHGLEAPEQRIVVIRDPMDTTRTRRFLALESDLDPKFINNQPMGLFNEEQYFRQLVASLLRVDKDLSGSNVFGNVVADAGPAGVFNRASGLRDYQRGLPSMEDQALINLLGIRGGAKRAFAESTLGMMAGLTPQQYKARMLAEIQKVIPRLKETIASFKLTDPTEVGVYDDMIKRLEQGLGVDWSKFHAIHSAVKPAKPKGKTQAIPGYKNGVVSVPGPKGAGDVIAAMLAPGEAVIPAEMAKKYAPLIEGMVSGSIPGYIEGLTAAGEKQYAAYESYESRKSKTVPKSREAIDGLLPGQGAEAQKLIANAGVSNRNAIRIMSQLAETAEQGAEAYESTIAKLKELITTSAKVKNDPNIVKSSGQLAKDLRSETGFVSKNQSTNKEVFAHIGDGVKIAVSEALAKIKSGELIATDGEIAKLEKILADKGAGFGVDVKSGLGMQGISKETNRALAKEGADIGKFTEEFDSLGIEKWNKSIEFGGGNVKELSSQTQLLDKEFSKLLAQVERGTLIFDKEADAVAARGRNEKAVSVESLYGQSRANVKGQAPELVNALDTAQGTASQLRSKYGGLNTPGLKNRGKVSELEQQARVEQEAYNAGKVAASTPQDDSFVVSQDESKRASPHRDAAALGKQDQEAYNRGAESVAPKDTRKIRRSSSDPAEQARLDQINQQATQATTDSANIAAGRFRGYRSASAPQGPAVPVDQALAAQQAQEAITKASQEQLQNLQKMSMSISAVSFGLSSLTGILSSFGVDLGGIMPVISGVTGALFALSMATSALTQAKFAETIATKVNIASGGAGFLVGLKNIFTGFKAGATGLKGFKNVVSGVAGAFKTMFPVISRLIIPLGVVATIFAGFELYKAVQEEQRKKIEGLGNAAAFSADQLKELGNKLNVSAQTVDYTTGLGVASGGQTTEEQQKTAQALDDPDFATKYADAISGIENATKEQAERALSSLVTQMVNSGFDEDVANSIIAGIIQTAERTDLQLKFNSIKIDSDATAAKVVDSIQPSIDAFNNVDIREGGIGPTENAKKEAEITAGAIKASFDSLTVAFNNGLISLSAYESEIARIFALIESSQAPKWLLEFVADDMGIGDFVKKLDSLEAKAFAVEMAVANLDINPEDEKVLEAATGTPAGSKEREAATEVIESYADALATAAANQEALNKIEAEKDRQEAIADVFLEQKEALELNDTAYSALRDSGLEAADAVAAVGNAAFMEAFALAATAGERQAIIDQYKEFVSMVQNSPFEQAKTFSSGGGQKSPFQEAIDSLKEQQKEAKNSITSYAKLRSAGLGVAEASEIAKDSMLAAALASEKVGTRRWNQLVTAIRAAKEEEQAWLNSTPEGRTQLFEDVYDKVMDVFSAQEAVLEANTRAATKVNRDLIKSLEKQIDAYNRRASELQRDLDGIAEKEDEINKAYDERSKALQTVKKLNQDIANQQKSQVSIADALSRGDISAAASAMEDARAQSAAAQGDATERGLDAARQAQLGSLTQNGKTRAEIEAEIKQIKKDVAAIEFGALQTARDAVEAAEEDLEIKKTSLMVAGQTKEQIELAKANIDLAKASAQGYDGELQNALASVTGIVEQWRALGTTFTTTHRINTIVNPGSPSPATSSSRVSVASGGYISGPGTKTSDSIPAMLSDGEYVIKAASVNKFGKNFLDAINAGRLPGFTLGGMIPKYFGSGGMAKKYAKGGLATNKFAMGGLVSPKYFAMGGLVSPKYFANGGMAQEAGTVSSRIIPKITDMYGPLLTAMSSSPASNLSLLGAKTFSQPVYNMPSKEYADVGGNVGIYSTSNNSPSLTALDNSVYNYSLSVNVEGTNASANDIANVVMNKIKTIESQQVRRQVLR